MEFQKSILKSLVVAEVVGSLACGVAIPQQSPDNLNLPQNGKVVKIEHDIQRWGLLEKTTSWYAVVDNTTFDWVGLYCRGTYTENQKEISATCEGDLITMIGSRLVHKGEGIDCPRTELPLMNCILEEINPPLIPVHTIYSSGDTITKP